jgi:hypothetical protein
MGIVDRKRKLEEPGSGGGGLELDLDIRSCTICRRDLHPWETVCPDDGGEAVPRTLLASPMAPPPAYLLAFDDDVDDDLDDEQDE